MTTNPPQVTQWLHEMGGVCNKYDLFGLIARFTHDAIRMHPNNCKPVLDSARLLLQVAYERVPYTVWYLHVE